MGKRRGKSAESSAAATATQPARPPVVVDAGRFDAALAIVLIDPSPNNPRTFREDGRFAELANSIREMGVLEPVLVRPRDGGRFELLAGERRWRASRHAGRETIPALIRELDDVQALDVTVTENLHRDDLQPIDEARGVRALINSGRNLEDIAAQIGKTRQWVARRASLTNLIPEWVKLVEDPQSAWSSANVRCLELIASVHPDGQRSLLQFSDADHLARKPESLKERVDAVCLKLGAAPFHTGIADLITGAPACTACPKRASCSPDLFDGLPEPGEGGRIPKGDRCLDIACWKRKAAAAATKKVENLRSNGTKVIVAVSSYGNADREALLKIREGRSLGEEAKPFDPWQYDVANQNEPGAFATVNARIGGPDFGKVEWFKPRARANGSSAGDRSGAKQAPTIKDKIAGVHMRRIVAVSHIVGQLLADGQVDTQFDGSTLRIDRGTITVHEAIAIATLLGTHTNNTEPGDLLEVDTLSVRNKYRPAHEALRERLDLALKNPPQTTTEALRYLTHGLTQRVLPVLKARLFRARMYKKDVLEQELRSTCSMLRIDLPALLAAQETLIPYPKSWRAEAEQYLAEQAGKADKPKAAKKSSRKKATAPAVEDPIEEEDE